MKTIPLGIAGLAFLTSGLLVFSPLARAQDGEPQPVTSRALSATVDYGNDANGNDQSFQPTKHGVDFDLLGLRPQQAVTITVQFPVELAGQLIIVEPLDGGIVTIPEGGLFVAADGTVTFPFQARESVGACRITVHQSDDMNALHFWIIDAAHPEDNPTDLPGAY